MNNDELNEKLNQITIEDYIWIIYLGIIFLSWYGNSYERKYYINNDINSKTKYKNITILIFSILIIVYLYFFKNSVNDLKNIKPYYSKKKKDLIYLSFLGSLFVTLSGAIFLFIAITDNNLDVEIAFN
ncbi:MAG: hypothetical protein ILA19_04805 [Bacilli bacterium]|nr:hypothetical protein [Bacilli bacterium]